MQADPGTGGALTQVWSAVIWVMQWAMRQVWSEQLLVCAQVLRSLAWDGQQVTCACTRHWEHIVLD